MQRLRRSQDITATLRGSRRCVGELVAVHVRTAQPVAEARIAVIASKKVGTAVSRNRAKRLLREAARDIGWIDGIDVVLVARRDCPGSDFQAVRRDVARCAERLDISRETTP